MPNLNSEQIKIYVNSDKIKKAINLLVNQLKKTYAAPEVNLNRHRFAKLKPHWLKLLSA